MTRVLIVAAYPLTRAGLGTLLQAEPDLDVAGDAADPAEVVPAVDELAPDVLLLDPGDDTERWLDDLANMTEFDALPPVLLITGNADLAAEALRAGVAGILLRDATPDEIVDAVRAVEAGLVVLDRRAAREITVPPSDVTPPSPSEIAPSDPLTPREREILQLIAQGLPNKAIASQLGISEHTVKFHVGSILDKLGASSRAEALARASRAGLIVL